MEESRELLKEFNIQGYDRDLANELANTRRPLVLIRGKEISREQVIQLITGEEPLFIQPEEESESSIWDIRNRRGVLKNILYRQGYSWLDTWIHTDGTVGGNMIYLGKYPELEEIIPDYICLKDYKFLDMIISYTLFDEDTCFLCASIREDIDGDEDNDDDSFAREKEKLCKCKDCLTCIDKIKHYKNKKYNEHPDFEEMYYRHWENSHVKSDVHEGVALTIWIHDGQMEIFMGQQAQDKFKEYNSLYSSPEYDFMFSSDIHDYNNTCIIDKQFLEECFEYVGRPRETVDEYIKQGFISEFNNEAIVVTKQWVTEQYNKMKEANHE